MTFRTRLPALVAPALFAIAALACAAATARTVPSSPDAAPPLTPEGIWIGRSTCTEQALLCDDQDVAIHVTPAAKPGTYDVEFAVIDRGVETPDNRLTMTFNDSHVLTAHFSDEHRWKSIYLLAVEADVMTGVLMVNGHKIERSLKLRRTAMTATPLPAGDGASSAAGAEPGH